MTEKICATCSNFWPQQQSATGRCFLGCWMMEGEKTRVIVKKTDTCEQWSAKP